MTIQQKVSLECGACGSTKFRGEKKSNFKDSDILTCKACGHENLYGDLIIRLRRKISSA